MKQKTMLSVMVVGVLCACQLVAGAAVTYTSQGSYADVSYAINGSGDAQSIYASGYAPFNAALSKLGSDNTTGAAANVSAVFGADQITGQGSTQATSAYSDRTTANGTVQMQIGFTLDEEMCYTLSGLLTSSTAAYSQFGLTNIQTYQSVASYSSNWGSTDSVAIDQSGTLAAGNYMLVAYTNAWAGGNPYTFNSAGFDFALTFSDDSGQGNPVVPAPAASLLAGLGVSLVGWLRRRCAL